MHHLDFLDRTAALGHSPLHRASALSKLVLVAAVIGAMLSGAAPSFYLAAIALLLGLAWVARLPLKAFLELLAYPVVFAGVFAVSGLVPAGEARWVVVARSATVALAVLLLFATTFYGDVFAALRLVMPGVLGDVLLLTYRSFFILARELQRTLTAIRLKGGGRGLSLAHHVRTVGAVMGLTAVHALEMAERMHRILALRGYRGVIPAGRAWWRPTPDDWLPILAAATVVALAAALR